MRKAGRNEIRVGGKTEEEKGAREGWSLGSIEDICIWGAHWGTGLKLKQAERGRDTELGTQAEQEMDVTRNNAILYRSVHKPFKWLYQCPGSRIFFFLFTKSINSVSIYRNEVAGGVWRRAWEGNIKEWLHWNTEVEWFVLLVKEMGCWITQQ